MVKESVNRKRTIEILLLCQFVDVFSTQPSFVLVFSQLFAWTIAIDKFRRSLDSDVSVFEEITPDDSAFRSIEVWVRDSAVRMLKGSIRRGEEGTGTTERASESETYRENLDKNASSMFRILFVVRKRTPELYSIKRRKTDTSALREMSCCARASRKTSA